MAELENNRVIDNMGKYLKLIPWLIECLLITYLLILTGIGVKAQHIENVRFKQVGDNIIIYYDLLSNSEGAGYDITIYLSTDKGATWSGPLKNVTGDVGPGLSAGNKKITWNVLSERESLKGDIVFEIRAKQTTSIHEKSVRSKAIKEYQTIGLLTRSTFMPGWGQFRISNKESYFIIGMISYACIGTSIYLNYKANYNYSEYKKTYPSDLEKANELFHKSTVQYTISNYLGYSAAAIWVADIIWTAISASNYHAHQNSLVQSNRSIFITCDEFCLQPVIGVNIKF